MANKGSSWCRCVSGAVAAAVLLITLVPRLSAQTAGTGALTGTVTDSTGAVIPNATITATSVDTGQARTSTTGSDGSYTINLLPPGNYRLKFEAPGFNPVEVPSATVNVTETEVLNRSLQVGAQTQEVTVQADVEAIQTASSALGTVVNTETVNDLPLDTRNYTNLLAMSAGANASVQNATSLGKGAVVIAVNGGGNSQNTFLQDGVAINDWYGFNTTVEGTSNGTFAVPNPDTIAEFKIQTSTYDAGYGRNPGANVNVITKSGTNDFHGVAFEFFRNTILNANDWIHEFTQLSHGQANTQPVLNQNQFGGVFGGPVKKNKLFFFTSYQETQQKNGLSGYGASTVTLPPLPTVSNRGTCPAGWSTPTQCDAAGQAFISALPAYVCSLKPSTSGSITIPCAATPSNPLANINPVAISLLQLKLANGSYVIPASGSPTTAAQTFTQPAIYKDHMFLGNFDYVINAKNTLAGRYEYEQDPISAPFGVQNASFAGTNLPGSPVTTTKHDHSAVLRLTSLLTPNFVNEARISFQRYVTIDTELSQLTNSSVGIADLDPSQNLLSYLTISGFFSVGSHYFFGGTFPDNQYEWADQISWTHGKHSVRAGFEAERVQAKQVYPSLSSGNPTFASFADFLIGRASCLAFTGAGACGASNPGNTNGSPSASNVQSAGGSTEANSQFPYPFRDTELNAFVQDDLKVNSRLTLNLGVRWEFDGYPTNASGIFTNFWPSLSNTVPLPTTPTLAGFMAPNNYNGPLPAGLYKSNMGYATQVAPPKDDFAPRVGFAWQPTLSNRWVLRGGAGYFYDLLGGLAVTSSETYSGPGVGFPTTASPLATLALPYVLPTTIAPGPLGSFGFPLRFVTLPTSSNVNGTSSSLSTPYISPNITVPLVYEWNLNTQYEFAPSWVVEVGYVGSHGIHQATQGQTGQGSAGSIPFNLAQLVGPTCVSCPLTGVTTNSAANAIMRARYLGISTADTTLATNQDYKFNSAQLTIRKQISHGLRLQGAYTWSRGFFALPYGENQFPYLVNRYALNGAYRPQRLVVNYTWNLPFGHPQGIEGKLVEGWTLSGVTTIQDGSPMTIFDSRGGSVFGAPTSLSTAQFCPGMGNGNVLTSGSLQQRTINGLNGGTGYLNGQTQSVFCTTPVLASPGLTGNGFGNEGLGTVLGPPQDNWDMALSKLTSVGGIREDATLEFRAEFFNTFNHPQFNNPNVTTVNAGGYGQIVTMAVNPRVAQFALKYSF